MVSCCITLWIPERDQGGQAQRSVHKEATYFTWKPASEYKTLTRFFEEFFQDIVVGFFLPICFGIFFLIGPFFHQVRDAMAFKSNIVGAFAFLMFVRVSWITVFPFLPVFLRAVLVSQWVGVFDCWLAWIAGCIILFCMHTLVDPRRGCQDICITLRVLMARSISIS